MKKLTLLILAFVMVSVAFGKRVVINGNGETQIQMVSSDKQSSVIEFTVNAYDLSQITSSKGSSFVVNLPDGSPIQEKGAPDIGKVTASVIISDVYETKIDVLYSDYIEIENIDIAPSRGNLYRNMNLDEIPFDEGKAYETDEFYPGKLAELRDPYVVRDFRGQTIITYPLQYNPVKNVLRIYTKIQVRVSNTFKQGKNPLSIRNINGINTQYSEVYNSHFINYSRSKYEPVSEEGNMLVVCHPDYMEAIAPFVAWKTKKGIAVELVEFSAETTGTSADNLKTYLSDYYTNTGLTYLLLVGDAEDIPSLYQSGDSDVAYSYISGSDSYPEFFVGRFSAENAAHVTSQVDKVIYYERDMDQNATWVTRGMGIASDEGGGGQGDDGESDIQHMDNIKADLTGFGYTYVAEVYDPGATAAEVATDVNEGVSVINYVGHGSDYAWVTSGFGTSDCNSLTNVNKYPYIFDVACVNGNFHGQTCFAEAWARATHNNEATGSVAIIASTINQSWAPPMDGQDEMVDLLVESYEDNIKRSFGGISYNGCMHMNDEYGADGDEMTDTWTTFGDPSLIVRTKTPEVMSVTHNAEILIGMSELVVNVPTEGALASLSLNGEVLGVATATGGSATIQFEALTEVVTLDLVVTGYNKVTYLATVDIIPADGPYLSVNEFVVNDEDESGSIEYGESFNIDLTLKNVGTENSTGITVSITSTDPYVESMSNNIDIAFADIASNEMGSVTGQFDVQLKDSVPDQYLVEFQIVMNDAYTEKQSYSSTRSVIVNAPVIKVKSISYNDNFEGNLVNGIIDAGETGEVIFTIENSGHADLEAVQAELSLVAASEYLTINTAISEIEVLEMVSPSVVKFNVTASEDTPLEEQIPVNVTVTGGAYEAVEEQVVVIGVIPIFVMGEQDVVTACSGTFFDSGDENGEYGDSETSVMTFVPSMDGNMLEFIFESFDVESGYDYLYVYNGESTDAEEFPGSPFSGDNAPTTLMASNAEGAITFKFTSDSYVSKNGWKATFECVDATAAPECAENPMPEVDAEDVLTTTSLSWDPVSGAVEYDIYIGETLPDEPTATVNINSYMASNLDPFTTYEWKVIPKNMTGLTPEDDCGSWTFTTGAAIILMFDGTVSTCEAVFMDPAGTENYTGNDNYTLTIEPDTDGNMTQVEFIELGLETGYDYIKIYDGTSASANLIGEYEGTDASVIGDNGTVTATNADGALTFYFYSDGMVNYSGWVANVTCVEPAETYSITFNVTDTEGPVKDATIAMDGHSMTTNDNGVAEATVEPGTYGYTITCVDHFEVTGEVIVTNEDVTVDIEMIIDGINDEIFNDVSIYPNPSNGVFTITGVDVNEITIYNTAGVVVATQNNIENNSIEVDFLDQGLYFIELKTSDNQTGVRKIQITK